MAAAKEKINLAWDVEATGNGTKDVAFAVGFAFVRSSDLTVHKWRRSFALGRAEEEAWQTLWERRGYSAFTFAEFWSRHIGVLDALETEASARDAADLARMVDDFLASLSQNYEVVRIVSDTVSFDGWMINNLLVNHGFSALHFRRGDGRYVKGVEKDGYIRGALGLLPDENLWDLKRYCIDLMLPHLGVHPHSHMPDEDAAAHAVDYERTVAYQHFRRSIH